MRPSSIILNALQKRSPSIKFLGPRSKLSKGIPAHSLTHSLTQIIIMNDLIDYCYYNSIQFDSNSIQILQFTSFYKDDDHAKKPTE